VLPGSAVFGLLGAGEGFALDVGGEDDVERLGRGGVDVLVLADADLGEKRLVGQAPVLVVAASVDPPDVGGQREAVVDVASGLNIGAFNLGIAGGAWIGGLAVDQLGLSLTPFLGAVVVLGGLALTRLSGRLAESAFPHPAE